MNSLAIPTVLFFAMTKKGLEALKALVDCYSAQAVECVVGGRDSAIQEDYYEQIRDFCTAHKIQFTDRQNLGVCKSKYAFAIGWRWLIHESGFKLIVFHDSLLPRYRGFAPLVNGLINGEKELGVTALCAEQEYDRGAILAQAKFPVTYPLKIATAIEQASTLYSELVLKIYRQIRAGQSLDGIAQNEAAATYSLWRDAEDYRIDWNQSAEAIQRHVDAVGYPYLGATSILEGQLIRILAVEVLDDVHVELRHVGKVLSIDRDGRPAVVCGQGMLKITEAIEDGDKQSILPLKRFRSRFR